MNTFKTVTCFGESNSEEADFRYIEKFTLNQLDDDSSWEQFKENLISELENAREELLATYGDTDDENEDE